VVSMGLAGAASMVMLLCLGIWTDVARSAFFISNLYFISIWIAHGLFQSTGGPVNTAIMGNWFGSKHRGLIFGTWTCHQYIGNIIGALIASIVLASGIEYWWALVISFVANYLWAFVVATFLPVYPDKNDIEIETESKVETESSKTVLPASTQQLAPITISEAFCIPSVASYALAFGFFKLVNYTLFFWVTFLFNTLFFSCNK